MTEVMIIGGGFAGLSALRRLSWYRVGATTTLIERKRTSDFLPELPDCLGRGVKPARLALNVRARVSGSGARLIQAEAASVDLDRMEIHCSGERLRYDYLIIAAGSETNFYGQDDIKKYGYKLDDAEDAAKLKEMLDSGSFDNIIVAGAGYTGIEAATNMKLYCDRKRLDKKVCIVERAGSILGPLPRDLMEYTALNLARMRIKTFLDTTILKAGRGSVTLSTGDVFENTLLVWAAGVRTGEFVEGLKLQKGAQGRIKVNEYLKAAYEDRIFAAGDAAEFIHEGKPLRMGAQFAITQGALAAENIARSIRKRPLARYRPVDLGYIVPMANNRSCGIVFGRRVSGPFATFLHYAMCLYRLPGLRNKLGLLMDIL